MANERQLIDLNDVFPNNMMPVITGDPWLTLKKLIDRIANAPVIDAMEVVRCKDCKHRGDDVCCPMCFEEEVEYDDDGYMDIDFITHDRTSDDGFCDCGERETT